MSNFLAIFLPKIYFIVIVIADSTITNFAATAHFAEVIVFRDRNSLRAVAGLINALDNHRPVLIPRYHFHVLLIIGFPILKRIVELLHLLILQLLLLGFLLLAASTHILLLFISSGVLLIEVLHNAGVSVEF